MKVERFLNDEEMDFMYEYNDCNINDLYSYIRQNECENKRIDSLGEFDWTLTQSEKYKILDDLGLSYSDLELGYEGDVLSGYIKDGYIKNIARDNDIVWDKTIIARKNTKQLKNGLKLSKIESQEGYEKIATCILCGESRYVTGMNFSKEVYRCVSCGHEYLRRFRSSQGEELIDRLLTENNLMFEREVVELDPYRFDFVVVHNDIKYYIEVHGLQHYKPIEYFGGEVGFLRTVKSDMIKKKYAENQGIYVELDYREHDLKILEDNFRNQFLNKYIFDGGIKC